MLRQESIDARLTAIGGSDSVSVGLQDLLQRFQDEGIIVNK
jgi:hypothetical protein